MIGDPVRLGFIGVGWWGGVLATATAASSIAEVSGCFSRTAESREQFATEHGCVAYESLDEMFGSDIDGVVIATPHATHADLVVSVAEAGKHVFVDKPLTLDIDEADRAIAATDEAGVLLQVGHNRRRQPAIRQIKNWIEGGDLGQLTAVESVHAAPLLFNPSLPEWRRDPRENPVGGMAALGVHQIDTFHYLAGPIGGVYAMSERLQSGSGVDDTSTIIFRFASGMQGHLFTSLASGPAVEVAAFGVDAIGRSTGDGAKLTRQKRGSTDLEEIPLTPLDTIADEIDEFARSIRGESSPEVDGNEARRVVAVLEAIISSVESGQWTEVSYEAD